MQIDPFFQVPQHPIQTSMGTVNLPVLFKEGDYCIALFTAPRKRVEALLEGTSFAPAMTLGPFATVGLVMAKHSICSEEPYSVASFAIPVSRLQGFQPVSPWRELFFRPDQRHMGFYMLNSQVNNLRMSVAGAEVWGHPKCTSNIELNLDKSRMDCRVDCMTKGTHLMRFSGKGFRFWSIPAMGFNLFSIRGNQVIRAILEVRSSFTVHLPIGFKLTLGDQDHPVINPLRELGLNGRRPLVVLSSNRFQGRLHEGVVIEDLSSDNTLPPAQIMSSTLRV